MNSRLTKAALAFAVSVPCLVWVIHQYQLKNAREAIQQRRRTLFGTWEVQNPEEKQKNPSVRAYQVFNNDGTGEKIWEQNGKRLHAPFTYIIGDTAADTGPQFSQLEINCDWTYSKGNIIEVAQKENFSSFPIQIGIEPNRIMLNPYGSAIGTQTFHWSRVELKPLPRELKSLRLPHKEQTSRLIGKWKLPTDSSDPTFHIYRVFNRNGTGKEIYDSHGGGGIREFTYRVVNSRLEITSDWMFYGGGVLPLDAPSISPDVREDRVHKETIFFSPHPDRIYTTPDLSEDKKQITYWQRISL